MMDPCDAPLTNLFHRASSPSRRWLVTCATTLAVALLGCSSNEGSGPGPEAGGAGGSVDGAGGAALVCEASGPFPIASGGPVIEPTFRVDSDGESLAVAMKDYGVDPRELSLLQVAGGAAPTGPRALARAPWSVESFAVAATAAEGLSVFWDEEQGTTAGSVQRSSVAAIDPIEVVPGPSKILGVEVDGGAVISWGPPSGAEASFTRTDVEGHRMGTFVLEGPGAIRPETLRFASGWVLYERPDAEGAFLERFDDPYVITGAGSLINELGMDRPLVALASGRLAVFHETQVLDAQDDLVSTHVGVTVLNGDVATNVDVVDEPTPDLATVEPAGVFEDAAGGLVVVWTRRTRDSEDQSHLSFHYATFSGDGQPLLPPTLVAEVVPDATRYPHGVEIPPASIATAHLVAGHLGLVFGIAGYEEIAPDAFVVGDVDFYLSWHCLEGAR